jgi:hypothetical protein
MPVYFFPFWIGGNGELINFFGDDHWGDGLIGGALEFGGAEAQQWFVVPDYADPIPDSVTVSIWVWADTLVSSGRIVGNTSDATRGQFRLGLTEDGNHLEVSAQTKNGDISVLKDESPFPAESWQHVAFTFLDNDPAAQSGGMVRLYRNGQIVGELEATDGATANAPFLISMGALLFDDGFLGGLTLDADPGFWDGKMDDFGFWARALEPEEIVGIYEAGLEGKDLTQATAPMPPEIPLNLVVNILLDGSQVMISWDSAGAKLQSTGNIGDSSSWSDVPGAASPHTKNPTESQEFFRVVPQ